VECLAWNFFGMLSAYILYQPFRSAHAARGGGYPPRVVKRIVNAALDVFMNGLLCRDGASRPKRGKGRKPLR
jgi:hypothetical protein